MELVTGASGYVGGRLVDRLRREGRPVRAMAREPGRFRAVEGVEAVAADVLSGRGLTGALDGCSTAYYLIHSMEAGRGSSRNGGRGARRSEDFVALERRAAENFGRAAREAGVERIVYLGGMAPAGRRSTHLRARITVEERLLEAVPGSTALRASIVIGAGSASFRILVRLVERLRLLPLPPWSENRTQPIDERDVLEYLARTPTTAAARDRSLDLAGPDVLAYREMIERIADHMGVGRMPLSLGASLTPAASAIVSAVTGQPLELVRPLMESLESDVLPRDPQEAPLLYGVRPRFFDPAVEHALAEWEASEPLAAR